MRAGEAGAPPTPKAELKLKFVLGLDTVAGFADVAASFRRNGLLDPNGCTPDEEDMARSSGVREGFERIGEYSRLQCSRRAYIIAMVSPGGAAGQGQGQE